MDDYPKPCPLPTEVSEYAFNSGANDQRRDSAILDRYRCPRELIQRHSVHSHGERSRLVVPKLTADCEGVAEAESEGVGVGTCPGSVRSPAFDDLVDHLRYERYIQSPGSKLRSRLVRSLYYAVRPVLPLPFRSRLQRRYFKNWEKIAFPRWPLDVTVDELLEEWLLHTMETAGIEEMPFIWFWPEGASSAAIMTHDVETADGLGFCRELMDINESFHIPSSFQIVPESRYAVDRELLREIHSRGHEVNIQDLNHDGRLFRSRKLFERRIKKVNDYGRAYQARGFRAAVLYRNLEWFEMLDFEYDMSVPNVGHLEAQRGGCCSVFPYFLGKLLELPLTTTQDHSLFHILRQYSLDVWEGQITGIMQKHGLASFIVHPDYVSDKRCLSVYKALLALLCHHRSRHKMWIATAGEVNRWWRQRSEMKLVYEEGGWRIWGAGSERAGVAYAKLVDGQIVFSHPESSKGFRPVI